MSKLNDKEHARLIRAMANIRKMMAFFGYDISHWDDDTLLKEVQRVNLIAKEKEISIEKAILEHSKLTKVIDLVNKKSRFQNESESKSPTE